MFWSNSLHKEYITVSASKLVEYITFLVDNIFVAAGDQVLKQTVGIPMGTDCAPLLANLFLFFYEYNYVKESLKTNHASSLKGARSCVDVSCAAVAMWVDQAKYSTHILVLQLYITSMQTAVFTKKIISLPSTLFKI